ncbi:MAG TPA: hypothetical protein VFY82_11420 [Acidimicrobiales bacterium]|nr:hypothetical protein [Acidimicrobiales bacterium]
MSTATALRGHRGALPSAFAAFALLLGGCTAGSGADDGEPADPVAPASLAPGFTVVEGTELIGAPIPAGGLVLDGTDVVDDGWWATLILDGDPVEIVGEYLDQAVAAGLDDGDPRPAACDWMADRQVACTTAVARTPDAADPRSLEIRAVRGEVSGEPVSHLRLRYSTLPDRWGSLPSVSEEVTPSSGGAGGEGEGEGVAPPEPPDDWPTLPEAGDPFDRAWAGLGVLDVVPGSVLVAQPAFGLGCDSTDWSAVLRVEGDPDTILQQYVDQFRSVEPPLPMEEPATFDIGDGTTLTTVHGQVLTGSFAATLSLVTDPATDAPAWLAIESCTEGRTVS